MHLLPLVISFFSFNELSFHVRFFFLSGTSFLLNDPIGQGAACIPCDQSMNCTTGLGEHAARSFLVPNRGYFKSMNVNRAEKLANRKEYFVLQALRSLLTGTKRL